MNSPQSTEGIVREEGAKLEFGGDVPDRPGFYVNPALFTHVDNGMTIAQEEIFGPVATLVEVDGQGLLLGISGDRIELLHLLDAERPDAPAEDDTP